MTAPLQPNGLHRVVVLLAPTPYRLLRLVSRAGVSEKAADILTRHLRTIDIRGGYPPITPMVVFDEGGGP